MSLEQPSQPSKKTFWAGWILSVLLVLFFVMGGVMAILKPDFALEGLKQMGYPESTSVPIGIAELVCALLYIIPQTSVLGAILLTGYLGGATATHVRVEEPFFMPVIFGILVWAGIFLREPRVRALIPFRKG